LQPLTTTVHGSCSFAESVCLLCLLSTALFLCGSQVGSIVQQHAGAVDGLVSELLPIAAQYLANDAAAASLQRPEPQVQHQDLQQLQPDQQQQQQQVRQESVCPASSSSSAVLLPGLDQAAVTQQLVEYSLAIAAAVPSAEMARREFAWRNGWFLGRFVTPQHEQWLLRAGCSDLLLHYAKRE
jgi:hypothetical protein